MILRFLNIQGIAGIVVSLSLGLLLILQKSETRHWRKQSGQFEQLYRGEQAAFAGTAANYRAAADAARAADKAAAERVAAEQRAISERTNDAFHHRLADARTRAERLRREAAGSAADSRLRGSEAVPGVSAASGQPSEAAGEDRLPLADALTATEQAIQLDELIKWVRRQATVDPNSDPRSR
jgi:hypothetical protein